MGGNVNERAKQMSPHPHKDPEDLKRHGERNPLRQAHMQAVG